MAFTEIYQRCTGECLFATEFCPVDSWRSPWTRIVFDAKERLRVDGTPVSVQRLRSLLGDDVPAWVVDSLVEITFQDESQRCDCFIPSTAFTIR